ncbi:hypothetical protein OFO01_07080 [Campylobacter sp. JMF_01 NE2]|uniref:hypothetical protein n=1 Tax=unclassified Campylobacter TaxID=2593542 RepID=UPI0022E9E46B|nr:MULTISPECIES: hypothetical protein [unclassified Campylobacter]MDA3053274.1 hypothetical protein [Campylobacter sp. JMF_03 NE3]MDA3067543.1 hypothetical protein [Campylobacter sp. JMF_01 NE2]
MARNKKGEMLSKIIGSDKKTKSNKPSQPKQEKNNSAEPAETPKNNTATNKQKKENQKQEQDNTPVVAGAPKGKASAKDTKKKGNGVGEVIGAGAKAISDEARKAEEQAKKNKTEYGGVFRICFELDRKYKNGFAKNNSDNAGIFNDLAKKALPVIGMSALAYAGYKTLEDGSLGTQEARLLEKDTKLTDSEKHLQEDRFHKNLIVEKISDALDLSATNTRELANELKNTENGLEWLDKNIYVAVKEAIMDSNFKNNIDNLKASVEVIEKAFAIDYDAQAKFVENYVFSNGELDDKSKQELRNALNDFHKSVEDGKPNINKLETMLKDKGFSQENIDKVINAIDDLRKTESAYCMHNANVYAELAQKKEQIKIANELISKGKNLSAEDVSKIVKENKDGYAALMAVASNMSVEGSINKFELAIGNSENGLDDRNQIALKDQNFINLKSLELPTLLETAQIAKYGELPLKENKQYEQMSLAQLKEPNGIVNVNPFNASVRGETGVYFRDKNANIIADNKIRISTISEANSNLGNLLNYNTNPQAMAVIFNGLENHIKNRNVIEKGWNNITSMFKQNAGLNFNVLGKLNDFMHNNVEIQTMIKKGYAPEELQAKFKTMNSQIHSAVLSESEKDSFSQVAKNMNEASNIAEQYNNGNIQQAVKEANQESMSMSM